jgi:hypothetical protein
VSGWVCTGGPGVDDFLATMHLRFQGGRRPEYGLGAGASFGFPLVGAPFLRVPVLGSGMPHEFGRRSECGSAD